MADGPRALRPDEWDQLDALVSRVFRPEMFHDYPQLFDQSNRENLRVVAEDGKVVCHVGMTQRPASLAGCRVDVASIGAVATYEEYRGRGFASQCFQDACDKAAADGVDVMLISGGRGLYTRVGCRQVGKDLDFTLGQEHVAGLRTVRPPGGGAFTLEQIGAERIPDLRALHQSEPVRFIRHAEDWQRAFACGVVMNTASDFWGVSVGAAGEHLVAYVIVHRPDRVRRRRPEDPTVARVVEFGGVRAAVIAALPLLLDRYGTDRLAIHVQGTDPVLGRVLTMSTGLEGTPSGASGTLRVINFPQLMERCRPLLAERIGQEAAARLTFHADARPGSDGGGFSIRSGDDEVRLADLASLALFLFGSHRPLEPADRPPSGASGLLGQLGDALPLPSLWYGISYV